MSTTTTTTTTTQIKPFGVFTGTKNMNETTNNAKTSFGCAPSTPLSMQGFSGVDFRSGGGCGGGRGIATGGSGATPMIRPM